MVLKSRRRTAAPRRYRKRRVLNKPQRQQVQRIARSVVPRKEFRISATTAVLNPTNPGGAGGTIGTILDIFNISEGDQLNNRDGPTIYVKRIELYALFNQRAGNVANAVVQHALLCDRSIAEKPNLSTFGGFFEDASFTAANPTGVNTQAAYNYNSELWGSRPIYKRSELLAAGGTDGAGVSLRQFRKAINFKGKGHKVQYYRLGSTEYQKGAMYWFFNVYNPINVAQNETLDVQYHARVFFTSG